MHGWTDLSFSTKKNPAPRGEEDGQIIPAARDSTMYRFIAYPPGHGKLYCQPGGRNTPFDGTVIGLVGGLGKCLLLAKHLTEFVVLLGHPRKVGVLVGSIKGLNSLLESLPI